MIAAQDLVERALALRTVDESIVIVTDASEAALRWAGNSMTTNGISTFRTWTVTSIVRDADGARVGTVSSSSVEEAEIADVVRASESAAAAAQPAGDAMDLLPAGGVDPGWHDGPAGTGIDVFSSVAADLADGFDGADRLYGFAHHQLHNTWLGTSAGVRRRFTQPTGSVEINGKRGDASAWVGVGTADFRDVSVATLLGQLDTRLGWSGRTVELPAGRYETLLPPSAVADLMIYLMWTMEGRGAQEGRTALSRAGGTRVGERLTDLPLTLYSDPRAPGLEYAPFVAAPASSETVSLFDSGMDVGRVDWVSEGVVGALAYPRHAAEEFGAPVAAPGENLLLTGGGGADLDEMVARTERGLLLTTLWYIREVDPASLLLTGLTRDGVYLVEDGRVTASVNNFRFNESPLDLLRRVTEAGVTEATLPREWKDWFTRTAMPPLRIPDFHMSSISAAQ
ncbi:metallopeptidase TldD-related protein [Rhodococcus kronopolitis]|uniref:Metallopeptidase TldD-related protein n=1 Tax=Rhodococcus kronopolitis TaxID=1460226 RepID=A0ABV9FTD2_9NOCA